MMQSSRAAGLRRPTQQVAARRGALTACRAAAVAAKTVSGKMADLKAKGK